MCLLRLGPEIVFFATPYMPSETSDEHANRRLVVSRCTSMLTTNPQADAVREQVMSSRVCGASRRAAVRQVVQVTTTPEVRVATYSYIQQKSGPAASASEELRQLSSSIRSYCY